MTATQISETSIFMWYINTKWVKRGIYQCFSQRRCDVFNEESVQGTSLLVVKGYLHVFQTFWFMLILEAWLLDKLSHNEYFLIGILLIKILLMLKAYEITVNIRKRKGLKQESPVLADYIDKI